MSFFNKAQLLYKNKMEPYFYKAVLGIHQFRKTYSKKDTKKLHTCLNNSLKELDKAIELNDNNANLHYIRALVLYELGKFNTALLAIEKAIEKADENYAKYYFLRGCISACSQSYQKALNDCSIAINLDKDFSPAYLERGKCYYTLGDVKQAFLDIQKYISIKPDDSNIHLWAGNLLFNTGAYEDAIRAYSNYEGINKCEELLSLRAKCCIVLKELNAALNDLSKLVELKTPNNVLYYVDRECLLSLKTATTSPKDRENPKLENSNLIQGVQKLAKTLGYKISGDVFKLHDLYFYKSVYHFYLEEYEQALADLETAWACRERYIKKDNNKKKHGSAVVDSQEMIKVLEEFCSDGEDNTEDSKDDSKPSAFDVREYYYNKAIMLLMLGRHEDCIENLQQIESMLTSEQSEKLEQFLELIIAEKAHLEKKIDIRELAEHEGDEEGKVVEIAIFPYYNRLCSIFPIIKLPFSTKTVYQTRLSFCLPPIEPPSMAPTINEDLIDEITVIMKVLSVENRPEAPWIKRTFGGVMFTENFLDKEEKEIDNLNEVIKLNNLKAEDIYDSIERSTKRSEEERTTKKGSGNNLNDAILLENESTIKQEKVVPNEVLEPNVLAGLNMRRARTGKI